MQPNPEHVGARTTATALAIETHGLVRRFGEHAAVDGLDLAVARGESLGLLGPNGAGKTTTIRILSTLLAASSGDVRVLGLDPLREAESLRARIGVVPQELALYDGLSARENLLFFGRMHALAGAELARRTDWALERAGLVERADERVSVYSGGMKRRLNIVAALMHSPELLFMDEPTVGIDPQSRLHVFEMVEELRREGLTLVYTTHQLGEVERLCDRIVILDHGRAVGAGDLAALRRRVKGSGKRWARVEIAASEGTSAEQRQLDALRASGLAYTLEEDAPGLEEVFLALTGRALRDGA